MVTSPDHPDLQFVQARYFTPGRPDGPPLWIVIHDMEAGESSTRAESTAAYFATMPDGRRVSSHYCVDDDSVIQCVRLADVAWTVGNRPGNYRGINWELAGFARQTRQEWLDEFGRAMFAQMVPIVLADAAEYEIPLRRCTIDDLLDKRPGITCHNDLRIAYGGTTHTDPGPNFPWDYFLALLTGDDMEQTDKLLDTTNGWADRTIALHYGDLQKLRTMLVLAPGAEGDQQPQPGSLLARLDAFLDNPAQPAPVDVDALAAALVPLLVADPAFLAALADAAFAGAQRAEDE
jgi:hypothetical protein